MAAEPNYPTRPIELMVGAGPGGGTDLGARMISELSKKDLGQELVVVNKPGGGSRVAYTLLAKANPDGYTLLSSTDNTIVIIPHLGAVHYKPLEDFTFITEYGTLFAGFVVLADAPFRTFKDVVEFARANPYKFTVGTTGPGTSPEADLAGFEFLENVKIKAIPFQGAAPAATALLGGHVTGAFLGSSGFAVHLETGKVRLLAVDSNDRVDDYPNVPTLRELGYPIGFAQRYILSGPRNMERPIVQKLEETFNKAIASSEFTGLAKKLKIWRKDRLCGDALREAIVQGYKRNEELFSKLKKLGWEGKAE
jgi:tripartite-type tricarboxylate transporter receptor subunit TctC